MPLFQLIAEKRTGRVLAVPYQPSGGGFRLLKNKEKQFYFLTEVEGSETDVSRLENECSLTLRWYIYAAPDGRHIVPSVIATPAIVEFLRIAKHGTVVTFASQPTGDWVLIDHTISYNKALRIRNEAYFAI